MEAGDQPALTRTERQLLRCGVLEWLGPARPTGDLAVAMGFADKADLLTQASRLMAALDEGDPLSHVDWRRVLVATEIVFASDVFGSGAYQRRWGARPRPFSSLPRVALPRDMSDEIREVQVIGSRRESGVHLGGCLRRGGELRERPQSYEIVVVGRAGGKELHQEHVAERSS